MMLPDVLGKVLVVHDKRAVRSAMRTYLEERGLEVTDAATYDQGERELRSGTFDVAVIDHALHEDSALGLLDLVRSAEARPQMVVLTGNGSIDVAVEALQRGAADFLTKPVELPALHAVIAKLVDRNREQRRQAARRHAPQRDTSGPFFGESAVMARLAEQCARIASAPTPVLIVGETGTGKTRLASWIHRNSPRAQEPFVDLDCAGLNRERIESELFGHEKGAFHGADAMKSGLLEIAHRGTVLLDEIADVDEAVQRKLLRVIEENRFRRIGGLRDQPVDVRLIAATHQDVRSRGAGRRHRSDLLDRLSAVVVELPPLRERRDDIPEMARRLVERMGPGIGHPEAAISEGAVEALLRYSWPGNVRELRNVLERALILSTTGRLDAGDMSFELVARPGVRDWTDGLTLQELERHYIAQVLEEEEGRIEDAARRLGLSRRTLSRKLRELGIPAAVRARRAG